jgi:hypothetical protein
MTVKPTGGWMPNHPRYQMRLRNQLHKMEAWATRDQVKRFLQATANLSDGWKWSLALRSNYHKTIVTNNDPQYRIPYEEQGKLVKAPFGMILPDDHVQCSHYVQEELSRDLENPNRRQMKCLACNETFWVVKEEEEKVPA